MKYLYITQNKGKYNKINSFHFYSEFKNNKYIRKYSLISRLIICGNAAILFKLFLYILLFPLYLSKKNPIEIRKLNSLQIINIELFGKGYYNYISSYTTIMPKYIYSKNQTFTDYGKKSFNFLNNKTYNLTLEFLIRTNSISFNSLFANVKHLIRVDLSRFDSKVSDMASMFKNCENLEYVNFGNLNTSLVKSMESMFSNTKIQFLDLSKFVTNQVTNMNYMFSGCRNLLYLNLNNFETSKVTNMIEMFYNCKSLKFLNLLSFTESRELRNDNLKNIVSNINTDLIYCINSTKAEKISILLSNMKNPNACEHTCFNDSKKLIPIKNTCIDNCDDDDMYIYEYDNICYNYSLSDQSENSSDVSINDEKIINTKSNEEKETKILDIMENCSTKDFFKGLCQIDNQTLSAETKDNMINNIVDSIINGELDYLISEITNGTSNDYYNKVDNIIFQITTTDNQNNNEYNNISNINLGECEDILKDKYGIDPNDSLIILKIDYFMEGLLIPVIGYDVFHPKNYSKLNLDYCKDVSINYNIPVSINEEEISKYDPNSGYYNDECSTSTSEDGTDITLNDRQKEFNENNMSLCENKCNFTDYNISSKKSICMCEIKTKIYTISEILESKDTLSKEFNTENTTESSSSSLNTMKCFNALFSKYGLLKNLGNYFLLLMIVIFSVSSIFFYKVGYTMLTNDIRQIIDIKNKTEENSNIYNYEPKTESKVKKKKKKIKNKKNIFSGNPTKKSLRKSVGPVDSINTGKDINVHKSFSKVEFKHQQSNMISPRNNIKEKISELPLTDYELNFLSYKEALEKDKRTYVQYYISLIRAKHPIIFSFIPIKDYNSMIPKVGIFLLSFGIVYAINALFFNESAIHQIYKDKGEYNMGYFLPNAILSFLIAHILVTGIKYIFLSERNILEIKSQETRNKALDIVDGVKRCLIIKYIVFYVAGVLFLILFWYYLSSFCAVYQNSQIFLLINAFMSSLFSLIYPFFINLLPVVIRTLSMQDTNRELFYKISKIIQII